jgi:hypothetical protein
MILYYPTGPDVIQTPLSKELGQQICSYDETKPLKKNETYWPSIMSLPLLTSTSRSDVSEEMPVKMSRIEAETSAVSAKSELIEGVVDDIEGDDARVRLHYGNRENSFLFSVSELKAVGAGYPGAVFGVSIAPDYSYAIVHLEKMERDIRAQAPAPDLSFLEE